MRIGGIALSSVNIVDDAMEEKWLCTPCVLRWKHKTHCLSPRDADETVVDLKAALLASLNDDPETRELYEEWVAEQEEK